MAIIDLPPRFSDNFGDPIQKIFELIGSINQIPHGEEIILNYNNAIYTHPFFSLSLPLIIKLAGRNNREIILNHDFENGYTRDYMGYLKFPEGLDPTKLPITSYSDYLSAYQSKTYVPIINFPLGESDEIVSIRDGFLSATNKILVDMCGLTGELRNAMMYLIDEAVNNKIHHSKEKEGYFLAQFYKSKGYADIVVADIGRTLLESYKNSDRYSSTIKTHQQAMVAALEGKSTKSGIDRGFGISSSKDMLTRGLNGKYFLWSGNVFNVHTSELNDIVVTDETISWQGVYLCLRIPVVAKSGFKMYEFVE